MLDGVVGSRVGIRRMSLCVLEAVTSPPHGCSCCGWYACCLQLGNLSLLMHCGPIPGSLVAPLPLCLGLPVWSTAAPHSVPISPVLPTTVPQLAARQMQEVGLRSDCRVACARTSFHAGGRAALGALGLVIMLTSSHGQQARKGDEAKHPAGGQRASSESVDGGVRPRPASGKPQKLVSRWRNSFRTCKMAA